MIINLIVVLKGILKFTLTHFPLNLKIMCLTLLIYWFMFVFFFKILDLYLL